MPLDQLSTGICRSILVYGVSACCGSPEFCVAHLHLLNSMLRAMSKQPRERHLVVTVVRCLCGGLAARVPAARTGGPASHTDPSQLPAKGLCCLRGAWKATSGMAEDARSFVSGLTRVPVGVAVAGAANAQRLRLVRALELLHTSVVQLDAAHAEANRRSEEAEGLRREMEELKVKHVEDIKAARKEASVRHDLALQASQVRSQGAELFGGAHHL